MEINNVCVVGAGNMGHQIALQCALKGFKVFCTDLNKSTLEDAQKFATDWLAGRVKRERLTEDEAKKVLSRLKFTDDLKEAASSADIVLEAIVEKLDVKRELFMELDKICPPHTILATNSSYIVSSKIADVTSRPDKVLNVHFFNPALVMKLVEVVKGPHVSETTISKVMDFCKAIDRIPARINKEIYGFVVNRVFSAITQEACYLLDQGVASIEDIDIAVKNGLGHPMGPFELLDLTGIDLEYDVLTEKYRTTGNLVDRPSPSIVEKYAKGEYGRKTKKGFYDYE